MLSSRANIYTRACSFSLTLGNFHSTDSSMAYPQPQSVVVPFVLRLDSPKPNGYNTPNDCELSGGRVMQGTRRSKQRHKTVTTLKKILDQHVRFSE
jgi:hypothetical protein